MDNCAFYSFIHFALFSYKFTFLMMEFWRNGEKMREFPFVGQCMNNENVLKKDLMYVSFEYTA